MPIYPDIGNSKSLSSIIDFYKDDINSISIGIDPDDLSLIHESPSLKKFDSEYIIKTAFKTLSYSDALRFCSIYEKCKITEIQKLYQILANPDDNLDKKDYPYCALLSLKKASDKNKIINLVACASQNRFYDDEIIILLQSIMKHNPQAVEIMKQESSKCINMLNKIGLASLCNPQMHDDAVQILKLYRIKSFDGYKNAIITNSIKHLYAKIQRFIGENQDDKAIQYINVMLGSLDLIYELSKDSLSDFKNLLPKSFCILIDTYRVDGKDMQTPESNLKKSKIILDKYKEILKKSSHSPHNPETSSLTQPSPSCIAGIVSKIFVKSDATSH